eukprot:352068-Chlamydomonas_euryale.AAC.7
MRCRPPCAAADPPRAPDTGPLPSRGGSWLKQRGRRSAAKRPTAARQQQLRPRWRPSADRAPVRRGAGCGHARGASSERAGHMGGSLAAGCPYRTARTSKKSSASHSTRAATVASGMKGGLVKCCLAAYTQTACSDAPEALLCVGFCTGVTQGVGTLCETALAVFQASHHQHLHMQSGSEAAACQIMSAINKRY